MDIQQQAKYKVLLIGDVGIDEYQYGTVDRISPEAPVPVFKYSYIEKKPGMAANVKENLEALGIDTLLFGSQPSIKTRLIDQKSKQQIVRIDKDDIAPVPILYKDIESFLPSMDAVVISDYNKGTFNSDIMVHLIRNYPNPIFVDTKEKDLAKFHGCIVKINETEYLNRYSINNRLIVTLGNKGAMYKEYNKEAFYPTSNVEVTDVCGAGDTFLAALTYMYLETKDIENAIKFANKAAAITVQHIGVYAPKLEEIV